jgi:elongation factor Ts
MAQVTPQMVKELRDTTGAGMADCKKALDQAEGNMEKAVVFLRERGLAAAAKKSGRAASEGMVAAAVSTDGCTGHLVEVNCETDFVTRNEEFQKFVETMKTVALEAKVSSVEELQMAKYPSGSSVKDTVTALVAKIGENIMVRRYSSLGKSNTAVASYVHAGGRIGVLVELAGAGAQAKATSEALQTIGKDVALQVAAMKPTFLNRESITPDVLEREKEVFWNQYKNQGKPEAALPKIVGNRVETWFKEACLVDQIFVKDESKTVAKMVAEAGSKIGITDLKIANFVRMELGEGVEKKSQDFAAEVAEQMAAAQK